MEPGEARLISSVTLFAQDSDSPSAEVMYIFESVPTQGLLQLKVGAVLNIFSHAIFIHGCRDGNVGLSVWPLEDYPLGARPDQLPTSILYRNNPNSHHLRYAL